MNSGRVDMLLPSDNGAEDLGTGGIVPGIFFDINPDIKHGGRKHSLSALIQIVTVRVTYRETIYFSITNPCSCNGLDPLGDFPIFGCYSLI